MALDALKLCGVRLPVWCWGGWPMRSDGLPARLSGLQAVRACIVLPVATGMALVLTFLTLRRLRPNAT
jgi:hypothetical protein